MVYQDHGPHERVDAEVSRLTGEVARIGTVQLSADAADGALAPSCGVGAKARN